MKSKNTASTFPIVGIGASAGGLEAFEQFFSHLPADSNMAFVLVQHLDPLHKSALSDILQRSTTMPVTEALDQMPVAPNCVYVIPPNRNMTIAQGMLQLTLPEQARGQRMPIDFFMQSLAADQQANAIGIILSGTGTDGTLGLRAILNAGGITLVQEPTSAKYDGMPTSAINAGNASLVLLAEKMPHALLSEPHTLPIPPPPLATTSITKNEINSILMLIRNSTGHDFSLYKKSTIRRRIERRMLQNNIEDAQEYARYLKENSTEAHKLFRELLINVTSFFRDAKAFETLKLDILPQLCTDKAESYVFRVWVAGCASGEEAYSIAILLRELMTEANHEFKVQIYSTDLDDDAIATARVGLYPLKIVQDVTPERLQRFFIQEDTGYRIKKEIREMVVFAIHNVIKDPPFTKLDLLSCRNVMIYLEPELQNRLIPTFHYALNAEGILFLSPSESIGHHIDLFSVLNRKWKFYRSTRSISAERVAVTHAVPWTLEANFKSQEGVQAKAREINFAELTRRTLLQYFAPASVVTDCNGIILYVHGDTGKYLRPAPGYASLNVVEMAREGLEQALRSARLAAISEGKSTLNRELQVKTNGDYSTVILSVRPLPEPTSERKLLLFSFQDCIASTALPTTKRKTKPAELTRIKELERDLAYLKENNQSIIAEQQASNEELKSTSEEMQSTNEELQSTNEELETSKEELQSVNEELITVNSELQAKVEQLAGTQNDMKNLLDNINIGLIFLDSHLKIRSFTREALRVYRLVPADIGRPLEDIRSTFAQDDIIPRARAVLETLIPNEHDLDLGDGNWMLARIQPYRTIDNIIDGVVLTFTDITQGIRAITAERALALAQSIADTVSDMLLVLDASFKLVSASQAFYQQFKLTPETSVGLFIFDLAEHALDIPELHELLQKTLHGDGAIANYSLQHHFPILDQRQLLLNTRNFAGKVGEPPLILLSLGVIP